MFGRATIRLGIGPHSSLIFRFLNTTETLLALFLISFPFTTARYCINVHVLFIESYLILGSVLTTKSFFCRYLFHFVALR